MWVGLGPAVFALGLSVPAVDGLPVGVGEALGCSGAGNVPVQDGWTWLKPPVYFLDQRAEVLAHVATDGFFAIVAEGNDLSLEDAQAQLRVVVRDGGGTEVPGDVSVLKTNEARSHLFGWAARQPLAVGTSLTVTLATEPASDAGNTNIGGEFSLEVEGAPTPLPVPEASFFQWGTFYRGVDEGARVQCQSSRASCTGPSMLSLPSRVTEQVATDVLWTPPPIVGSVAWSVRVEVGANPGEVAIEQDFLGKVGGPGPGLYSHVIFRDPAERYCVNLVLEDLRTHLEQRTELCSEPGPLVEHYGGDTALSSCDEPPTPELTPTWCAMQPTSTHPACAPFRNQPPPAASPDAGAVSSDPSRDEPERSIFGCALGAARPTPPAIASLAALALAWLVRRRGQRRSAR